MWLIKYNRNGAPEETRFNGDGNKLYKYIKDLQNRGAVILSIKEDIKNENRISKSSKRG